MAADVHHLISDLTATDPATRTRAAEELSRLGPEAVPAAVAPVRVCGDESEEVREIAVVRYPLREDSDDDIIQWAGELAAGLMTQFQQEQISAVIRDEFVVFARE